MNLSFLGRSSTLRFQKYPPRRSAKGHLPADIQAKLQVGKKFFDESDLKKLPTVRSLQAEYAALLAERKAAYADFRKAREDMKELLTVRANVQKLIPAATPILK